MYMRRPTKEFLKPKQELRKNVASQILLKYSLFSNPNEYVFLSKFERKDAVSKIMPVDNEFATSQHAHKLHQREGGYTRRVLASLRGEDRINWGCFFLS